MVAPPVPAACRPLQATDADPPGPADRDEPGLLSRRRFSLGCLLLCAGLALVAAVVLWFVFQRL